MYNRFIERFVNKITEKNGLWLWVYGEPNSDINFILIQANTRREAIIKLLQNPKYISSLFHTDITTYVNETEINETEINRTDLCITIFEKQLEYDRGCNFRLLDLSKLERI